MYLYQEENVLQGITDEFTVKRKSTTSYSQLQKLAKENDCALGEKDWFDDNQHALYVPKSSRLNAMQMSNLFYETGYFEYAEPNMFRWIPDFRFPNN
jgi:hypothetical protein